MNEENEMAKIRDVIKNEFDQFVLVNKSINNINDSIDDINNKSSEFNSKISKSKDHVNNLIKKHRREKYMLYFSFLFFVLCCSIVIIRRIPLFLVIKWGYYLVDFLIKTCLYFSEIIISIIPINNLNSNSTLNYNNINNKSHFTDVNHTELQFGNSTKSDL